MACDPYWNKTVLACHFDGANGSTTFTDEKGHTLTANGGAQISTAQSKFGGSSAYFDGSSTYLSVPETDFNFGTGDFTIEMWVCNDTSVNSRFLIDFRPAGTNGAYISLSTSSTNTLTFWHSAANRIVGTAVLTNGVWKHVALCRASGVTKLFIDGVQDGASYTDATSYGVGASRPRVGSGGYSTPESVFKGYIDDLRVTNVARYTANFTPDTSAFVTNQCTISGTVKDSTGANAQRLVRVLDRKTCSVLNVGLSDASTGAYSLPVTTTDEVMVVANDTANADPYWSSVALAMHMNGANGSVVFTDEKGKTVTPSGNAQISTAQSKFGGASAYFDGTGDYLTVPASTDLTFGTGDFTIEFHIYPQAYGGTVCGPQLFGTVNGGQSGWAFHLGQNQDTMRLTSNLTGSWADNFTVSAGGGPALNTWSHIAIVRNGANVTIYKNGVSVGSTSSAAAWNFGNGPFIVGRFYDGTNTREFNGYIDDLRVTKGLARYTANFTAPAQTFPNSLEGGTENAVILDRVVPV